MASYTPNINLKKPTTSEYYNVLDENSNKDKIDTAIGTLNSQLVKATYAGSTFTDVNSNITINSSRINKKAGIVACTIAIKITGAISAYTKLFTIPVNPSGETNFNIVTLGGSSIPCYVTSSGDVYGRANIPVAEWAQANFAFME